jgi:hypothetical protein
MCKFGKFLLKLLAIGLVLNVGLFCVFFFDLDGKLLFNVVEPFLKKHYDDMDRDDTLKFGNKRKFKTFILCTYN